LKLKNREWEEREREREREINRLKSEWRSGRNLTKREIERVTVCLIGERK